MHRRIESVDILSQEEIFFFQEKFLLIFLPLFGGGGLGVFGCTSSDLKSLPKKDLG